MGPELPMSVDLTEDPAPSYLSFQHPFSEPLKKKKKQLPCLPKANKQNPKNTQVKNPSERCLHSQAGLFFCSPPPRA